MYKAVIFDFFGVFCPDMSLGWFNYTMPDDEAKLKAFHEVCNRSDLGQLSRDAFYAELTQLTGVPVEQVAEGIESRFAMDGALIEFCRKLHNKYKLAIISNGTADWLDDIVMDYKLDTIFDEIVLSATVGMAKPGKDIFDLTLAKLGIKPGEAVFVDDRQVNVTAAQSHGLKSLLYTGLGKLKKDLRAIGI